jgi:hypothetical protein
VSKCPSTKFVVLGQISIRTLQSFLKIKTLNRVSEIGPTTMFKTEEQWKGALLGNLKYFVSFRTCIRKGMAGAACIGGKGRVELKSTVALKGRNSFLS